MNEAEALKEKLTALEENGFDPGGTEGVVKTVREMFAHIGSTDPGLRDCLIYATFHRWTLSGVFTPDGMRSILMTALDERHLFYGIGEQGTDSVFTRTFSVLLVPLAFYMDGKASFLSDDEARYTAEKVISYMKREKDARGFVGGKGWAHAAAHGADALGDLARSEKTGRDTLAEIVSVIKEKICINDYTYIHNEDDRMAEAAMSAFKRNLLGSDVIVGWIKSFGSLEKCGDTQKDLHTAVNAKNFLRSLYFKAVRQEDTRYIADAVLETL